MYSVGSVKDIDKCNLLVIKLFMYVKGTEMSNVKLVFTVHETQSLIIRLWSTGL
jgi:hypothetical protein